MRCSIHSGLLEQGACSGALAGAGDSDVDELGDGDDRHSGIENDAEIKSFKSRSKMEICSRKSKLTRRPY